MMNQSMNGFVYDTSTGVIKTTYMTKMPEWYKIAQGWNVETSTKWYDALASALNAFPGNPDPTKTTQFTMKYLWENRNKSVPKSGSIAWPLAVSAALAIFIGADKGSALSNWLCGGYLYKGTLGGVSNSAYDSDDFIDAEDCYSYFDPKIRISDCLMDIKKANAAAHDWVVRAASAKFANKVAHEAVIYEKALNAQAGAVVGSTVKVAETAVKVVKDVGTGLVKVAEGAAEGAGSAFSIASWLLSNVWWVLPATAAGISYFAWKNKGTIAKVATGAAIGGPAGAAAALAANNSKSRR